MKNWLKAILGVKKAEKHNNAPPIRCGECAKFVRDPAWPGFGICDEIGLGGRISERMSCGKAVRTAAARLNNDRKGCAR